MKTWVLDPSFTSASFRWRSAISDCNCSFRVRRCSIFCFNSLILVSLWLAMVWHSSLYLNENRIIDHHLHLESHLTIIRCCRLTRFLNSLNVPRLTSSRCAKRTRQSFSFSNICSSWRFTLNVKTSRSIIHQWSENRIPLITRSVMRRCIMFCSFCKLESLFFNSFNSLKVIV